MRMYRNEMYETQMQNHAVSACACPDTAMLEAHAAFYAVCAFFAAAAGDVLFTSSFAAVVLPIIILLPVFILISLFNLLIRQHPALRRQPQHRF